MCFLSDGCVFLDQKVPFQPRKFGGLGFATPYGYENSPPPEIRVLIFGRLLRETNGFS